jgi:hypothetical protein
LAPLGVLVVLTLILGHPSVNILTWDDPLADMLAADAGKKTMV